MVEISIDRIVLDENIRHEVGDVASLASSIDRLGILQPLLVAKRGDEYQLIDGHRRLAAAKVMQFQEVPVHVTTFLEEDSSRIAMQYHTNVERVDLSAYEKMQAAMDLKDEGYTQKDVAQELQLTVQEVSRQQKVVKTMSLLPNVADVDKLSEQALFDLADAEVEGDERNLVIENAVRSIVTGNSSSVRQALGGAEREARDVAVLELLDPIVAHLHKIGCEFVKDSPNRAEMLAIHNMDSNFGNQLGFDHKEVELHRTLDCHVVHMGKGYSGPVLAEYCIKPASHREKGKSGLKEASAEVKQQQRERVREDRKQAKEEKQGRQATAKMLLDGKWTQKQAIAVIDRTVRLGSDATRVAAKALGLDPIISDYGNYRDHYSEIAKWVDTLPASKQQLAPIMVLAAYMYIEEIGLGNPLAEMFEEG